MKVWTRSQFGGEKPKYHLTKEYSPDWWGTLQIVDGRWRFSCGLRGGASIASKSGKAYKDLNNAKSQAKSFLAVVKSTHNANRIFGEQVNEY
jgi:hypothetical protein